MFGLLQGVCVSLTVNLLYLNIIILYSVIKYIPVTTNNLKPVMEEIAVIGNMNEFVWE